MPPARRKERPDQAGGTAVSYTHLDVYKRQALGDPTINDHLILRAAALAGVTDFLRNNPAGFAAQVGEQGKALSGGQRQAVALARALVRDPEVLLLDEPTSNMDTDSELMLQKRLFSVMQDRTVVLVTHRLSMLRIVERLIVMENGQVIAVRLSTQF